MARIKLMQESASSAPRALHLVLQDIENTVIEIDAAAVENPALLPAETPADEAMLNVIISKNESDIQALDEMVETSLPAVGALEDTAYAIAPAIRETTPAHIALVRQVATVSGEALGIPAEEIIGKDLDNSVIGQPLVLEGFKEKAIAAAKAIWNAILNMLDKFWTLFQSNFRRTAGRLKKLKAIMTEIESGATDATVKVSPTMIALTQDGSLTAADVKKAVAALNGNAAIARVLVSKSGMMYNQIFSVVSKVKTADEIPQAFKEAAAHLIEFYNTELVKNVFSRNGDDVTAIHPCNGKKLIFRGMNKALSLKDDPLAAAKEYAGVTFVADDAKLKPVETVNYSAQDFKVVASELGSIVNELDPRFINHVSGITRINKRSLSSIAAKVTSDWTSIIDKAEPADQATAKPYVSAISQMINKHASLTFSYHRFVMGAFDDCISAGTALLSQGTGKQENKEEEKV